MILKKTATFLLPPSQGGQTFHRSHPFAKQLQALCKDTKTQEEIGKIAIFGKKIIDEWLKKGHSCNFIFRTPQSPPLTKSDIILKEDIFKWASGLQQVPTVCYGAIIDRPLPYFNKSDSPLLVLDDLQDPGNVGTLIRSAKAFGFKGVILSGSCCSPWNEKVIRSSAGTALYLPLWAVSKQTLLEEIELQKPHLLIADGSSDSEKVCENHFKSHLPLWIVIGNEGSGVSKELKKLGTLVKLPMKEDVESLNAAVAGSIFAFLLSRPRLSS